MSALVVVGEPLRIEGYALAGAALLPAEGPDEVRAAWARLPGDVAVLVLTPMAAGALEGRWDERPRTLRAVLPA